jgi:hypothetical protein
MTGKRVTLDELFEELRAKNLAEYDDPANAARREADSRRHQERIAAEIASGLRDEDGDLIGTDDPDEDEDLDEYDPDDDPEEF